MNAFPLPSPYELSRIAAALRGAEAGKKPEQSAKEALRLWRAAAGELLRAEMERERKAAAAKIPEQERKRAENPEEERISSWDGTRSPAMEWLFHNAEDKRDRFKTVRSFKKAYLQYFTGEWGFTQQILDYRRFLEWRAERRRESDAARKQRDAERKRLARRKQREPKTLVK